MAIDQRKRQKQLAKQRAKRKAKLASQKHARPGASPWLKAFMGMEFELASRAPVYECYVAEEIFSDQGIGQVIVTRLSGGNVAGGVFLIDAFCLGVKDAFALLKPRAEFDQVILPNIAQNLRLRRVEPAYAKKLILDAIDYARKIGFEPHRDYQLASKVLRDIDETESTAEFTFGKDGKPFYISGPHDDEARRKQVVATLSRRLGPDEFDYLIGLSPSFPFSGFLSAAEDEDWEEEEDDEEEEEGDDEDEDEDEDVRRRV